MPIKKASFKALRKSKKRASKNLQIKKRLKNLEKKFRKAIVSKDQKVLKELIPLIMKAFDKAAKVGLIKKNTSSRKKSRLMRAYHLSSRPQSNQ